MPTTFDDLNRMIQQGENAQVEFKSELSDEVVRKLSTSLAAMANFQGGRIVFGVTQGKDPVGLDLQGDERERISQQASNCRPAVKIDFEEIPLGSRHFLVVKVDRSRIVHNDLNRRFPIRIGNTTDYLDALGLLALLQERRLLVMEGQEPQPTPTERERRPLVSSLLSLLSRVLTSNNPSIRLEGLRDLASLAHGRVVFENVAIASAVQDILAFGTDNEEEIDLVLDSLRSIILWGTSQEKETVSPWLKRVAEIGISTASANTAKRTFDILELDRNVAAVGVLVHWVTQSDDAFYEDLGIPGLLNEVKFYGLDGAIREAIYPLLEKKLKENAKKRVQGILEGIRRAYG